MWSESKGAPQSQPLPVTLAVVTRIWKSDERRGWILGLMRENNMEWQDVNFENTRKRPGQVLPAP